MKLELDVISINVICSSLQTMQQKAADALNQIISQVEAQQPEKPSAALRKPPNGFDKEPAKTA